jgi:uncharacterized delta-60 repeat protein
MSDLDTTTFNTPNGYVITDFDATPTINSLSIGKVIALQPDGKIVMAGKFYDSVAGLQVVAVCRYLSNGTLDTAFGGSGTGKVTIQLNTGTTDDVTGIALQSDGKIVICGFQVFPSSPVPPIIPATSNIFVLRLTTTGILDNTGVGGFNLGSVGGAAPGYLYTTPADITSVFGVVISCTNCSAEAIAMQTYSGIEYIVVGGSASMYLSTSPSNTALSWYALARYTLNGVLDTTFAISGLKVHNTTPTTTPQFGIDLYVDSTQILLSGVKYFNPPSLVTAKMSVVKFDGNGTVDGFFGTGGSTEIPNFFTSSQDRANAIQVQTDGNIILGGTSNNNNSPQQRCFVLARLDNTPSSPSYGALDATYGSGGVVITDLSPSYNLEGRTMGIQPDDKIVLGGTWDVGTAPASFALARYSIFGVLDPTFGLAGTGLILEDIDPTAGYVEEGHSLVIQPDGKILMGGVLNENQNESGPQRFLLARYFGFPPFPPPIVPICFPAGTPVLTDQGYVEIDKIEPSNNTINGRPIIAITKTITPYDKLVCFERGSLGYNIPNRTTYISTEHCIVYRNKLIEAHKFVNRKRRIYYVKYNGKYLYNVLMNRHYCMTVNNIKVETLNPRNIIAKLYTNDYNTEYKIELINRINKHYLHKAEQNAMKERISKNMMLNYTRAKNQRYRIHRYNQLMDYKRFFTRKRAYNADHYPVVNVALQNTTNTTNTKNITDIITTESIQSIPQKISEPIAVESKAIESKAVKPKITKPKIKIDIIGKSKVTLKKIIGANNKLRICSHKYVSNKHK